MRKLTVSGLAAAVALGIAAFQPTAAFAQAGLYGAEDGYNTDDFGWGPAYQLDSDRRPFVGFYGGVERAYPYGAPAVTLAQYGRPVVRERVIVTRPAYRGRRVIVRDRVRPRRVITRRVITPSGRVVTRRIVVR